MRPSAAWPGFCQNGTQCRFLAAWRSSHSVPRAAAGPAGRSGVAPAPAARQALGAPAVGRGQAGPARAAQAEQGKRHELAPPGPGERRAGEANWQRRKRGLTRARSAQRLGTARSWPRLRWSWSRAGALESRPWLPAQTGPRCWRVLQPSWAVLRCATLCWLPVAFESRRGVGPGLSSA